MTWTELGGDRQGRTVRVSVGAGVEVSQHLWHGDARCATPGQTQNGVWQSAGVQPENSLKGLSQLGGSAAVSGAWVGGGWAMEPGWREQGEDKMCGRKGWEVPRAVAVAAGWIVSVLRSMYCGCTRVMYRAQDRAGTAAGDCLICLKQR